jgi:hypothetical protein
MYELHSGYMDYIPGDGYKLISTYCIFSGSRDQCWKKYHDLVEEHDVLLVKKPEITNCSLGYPTIWDEENAEIS